MVPLMKVYIVYSDPYTGGPSCPPEYGPPEAAFSTLEAARNYQNNRSEEVSIQELELDEHKS